MKLYKIKDAYTKIGFRIISDDIKVLNPLETKMIDKGEITAYGQCPYCLRSMNPDRWYIYQNGYECLKCGHKTYLLHEKPFKPCDCKNCKKNKKGKKSS